MTTTLDIIKQSIRETNIIGVKAVVTAEENQEALARLQSLVSSVFGNDVGEDLEDWPIGIVGVKNIDWTFPYGFSAWTSIEWQYPRINSRLLLDSLDAQTIWLPPTPDDGSRISIVIVAQDLVNDPITLDANGRKIAGSPTLVLNNPATAQATYMYNASAADWQIVSPITLDGVFPFPNEFDDYFITKLAMRLNPRYGRALTAESGERLSEMQAQLSARYRQHKAMPAQGGVLRLTNPGRYGAGYFYGPGYGRYGWMS